jgi:two-component system response regulator
MKAEARTILIVDDSLGEALITVEILSRISPGIRIETAFSGEAAMDLLRKMGTLPALILLDLKMLGLSGLDVIRLVRADERLKQIPIIVVSNSTLEADRVESIRAGANSFLHKHFDLDCFRNDLKALLETYLGNV